MNNNFGNYAIYNEIDYLTQLGLNNLRLLRISEVLATCTFIGLFRIKAFMTCIHKFLVKKLCTVGQQATLNTFSPEN